MLWIGLREQDGKFLPSITTYRIKLPQLLVEDGGHLPQDFVSEQMSKFVVQALELVDINHDHGHAGAESPGAFNFFGNAQLKEAAIENSGETVQIRQLFDSFHIVCILNSSSADIGYRLQ